MDEPEDDDDEDDDDGDDDHDNDDLNVTSADSSDLEDLDEPEDVKRAWEELMIIQREQQRYTISAVVDISPAYLWSNTSSVFVAIRPVYLLQYVFSIKIVRIFSQGYQGILGPRLE